MVLPQLYPGIGPVLKLIEKTKRCTVSLDRKHGAGGKIHPHTHNLVRCHHGHLHDPGYGITENLKVILRVLQRPVDSK